MVGITSTEQPSSNTDLGLIYFRINSKQINEEAIKLHEEETTKFLHHCGTGS